MGDPLSLTASIIAVCELASTVVHYFDGVRSASEDIKQVRTELQSLSGILHSIRDLAKELPNFSALFPGFNALLGKGGALERFKGVLEDLASRLGIGKRGFRRAARLITWPLRKDGTNEMVASLERYKTLFVLALSNDQVRLIAALKEDFSSHQRKVENGIEKLAAAQARHESREAAEIKQTIIDWLSPIDYLQRQSDIYARHEESTGSWFLKSPEYMDWVSLGIDTLWCRGGAGTGKTFLASIIVHDLCQRFKDEDDVGVFYLYCNYKDEQAQTVSNLLASICAQSLYIRPSLPNKIKSAYNPKTKQRPSDKLVEELLVNEIERYNKVFIVVDALDEFSDKNNERDLLLSALAHLRTPENKVQLLFTSRPLDCILPKFPNCKTSIISAQPEDIERYARSKLSELRECVRNDPKLQEDIVFGVCQTAGGMFLLAFLNVEVFKDKFTEWEVRKALENLPKGNDGLTIAYDQALERIDGQSQGQANLARLVLSIVLHASRPLAVEELLDAIRMAQVGKLEPTAKHDPQNITAFCAGLVIIESEGPESEGDMVRLVHYTAHSYLESIRRVQYRDGDEIMAEICLKYMNEVHRLQPGVELKVSIDDSGLSAGDHYWDVERRAGYDESFHARFPLFEYSCGHWPFHIQQAPGSEEKLLDLILQLEGRAAQLMICALSIWGDDMYHWCAGTTLLMIAAFYGFEMTVEKLLEQGVSDVNARPNRHTALQYATSGNQAKIVKILLEHGANVNIPGPKSRTPLIEEIVGGEVTMVTILLEGGADVNQGSMHYSSALHAVLRMWDNWYESLEEPPKATESEEHSMMDIPRNRVFEGGFEAVRIAEVEKTIALGKLGVEKELMEISNLVIGHPEADFRRWGSSLLDDTARRRVPESVKELIHSRWVSTVPPVDSIHAANVDRLSSDQWRLMKEKGMWDERRPH